MKWFRRLVVAAVLVVVAVVAYALSTAQRTERPVGFHGVRVADPGGQPFTVGVWYPTQARPRPTTLLGGVLLSVAPDGPVDGKSLPLVVISHGNGGGPGSHADLALALANAGYVVAAPMHTGDNFADHSATGSASLFNARARQLRATVDHMLTAWPGHERIDPQRIGAYGFSAGGFTALTLAGAQPDLRLVAKQCREAPEFVCDALRQAKSPLLDAAGAQAAGTFVGDPRIKAVVAAAPGLGFTLGPQALADVRVPVQLWSGDRDVTVPYATNARVIREALGNRVEFHAVPGAAHFSFLTPCGLLRPPGLCEEQGDFDRKAFHKAMNASVVGFFDRHLKAR